jgi:hypothetical protein
MVGMAAARWPRGAAGCVLAGYHYTAVSRVIVRHCYDPTRHPEMPFHIHEADDDPRHCDPITAEDALQLFEQRIAEELVASERHHRDRGGRR